MRITILSMLLAILTMFCAQQVHAEALVSGPSFDCRQAQLPDEQAVCGSAVLSQFDRLLTAAYRNFQPEFAEKREIARGVIADQRACGDEEACIAAVYANELSTYAGVSAPLWPTHYAEALLMQKAETSRVEVASTMPAHMAECVGSTIAHLTDRFGAPLETADADSGSAVIFANGGYQVSYDREDSLAISHIGDRVTICLFERPRDCPQGVDKGRVYLTINEDRQVFWLLPDNIHQCGGA